MNNAYEPCFCGSGKKFKFCCLKKKDELLNYPKFPIDNCLIMEGWEEEGISPIFVTRKMMNSYHVVIYLIDFWCLGLKDITFKTTSSLTELKRIYCSSVGPLMKLSYPDARSLILGSIDYAKSLGFSPHEDWGKKGAHFIEANEPYEQKFSFGREGHPYYMEGPYDRERYDIPEIMSKLEKVNGKYLLAATYS